jgi:hypothetical protein
MFDKPINLNNNDVYGSISRNSFLYISTKSLFLDENKYLFNKFTLYKVKSSYTLLYASSNQNTFNNLTLRVRFKSFFMSDSLINGVSERFFINK